MCPFIESSKLRAIGFFEQEKLQLRGNTYGKRDIRAVHSKVITPPRSTCLSGIGRPPFFSIPGNHMFVPGCRCEQASGGTGGRRRRRIRHNSIRESPPRLENVSNLICQSTTLYMLDNGNVYASCSHVDPMLLLFYNINLCYIATRKDQTNAGRRRMETAYAIL